MAFDSLTDKLQNVFKKLRSKGMLTEADVKEAMKEVKRALLEADVNFKVVKQFINSVSGRAVGEEVLKGLNPGQMVIKIVKEEMDKLMGSETTELKFLPSNEVTVIMMCGLQGAGKTTTVAKLAGKYKNKGKKPLLVACDIYRPAAIKQLEINGEKVGVPVFTMGDGHKPVNIARAAVEHAQKNGQNLVFLDTAGRLHVDEDMMNELIEIKENVSVTHTILTVDAMTGQDAVNVATSFNDKIGIDGVILTKLDGDTRGGAALSIKAVTGKPILFAGMGEKLEDLEQFYPDRMASRILGMGDVESLIEKAQNAIDEEKAKEMEQKFKKASFDFNDLLDNMEQMEKMGGIGDLLNMLPGFGSNKQFKDIEIDEKAMNMPRAIILSMTPQERSNPDIINPSRKKRIADGAGVPVSEVNKLMKQLEQSKKMMKQMSGLMGGKKKGGFRLPFGF
ncbi:MAG: signal recognition particle protein [Clostridium sp.]|nr:signal recognition particle protein [Clostridium sp.]MCM1398670.1 signal recognition particle protein [Clostridium sp.]MCM1458699.1 signal recognition particle protein [Bacteroides sp.]